MTAAPNEDGKDADTAIGRMGALLRTQERQADSVAGGSCARPGTTVRSGAQIAMVQETCDCEAPESQKNEVMFQKGEGKGGAKNGGNAEGKGGEKGAGKGGGKVVGKGGEKGGEKGGGKGGGGAKGPDAPAAAPSAVRVEVHVNPNWTAAAAPVRTTLGENSGLVSGVTTFGAIGGAQGGCTAVKGDCRGDCERIIYEWVHMDIDVNITYVRGMRAKAAHEAVHAQQMGNVFRAALQGIQQTAAFGCAPRATTERRLALCRSELLKEANRVGLRAISAWQAEREDFKTSSRDYRSDPMEREAFAEEDKGNDSGFPPGIEPPPEFRPPPPATTPAPVR